VSIKPHCGPNLTLPLALLQTSGWSTPCQTRPRQPPQHTILQRCYSDPQLLAELSLPEELSEGMEVPEERASRFKFARQSSKLAGTIRGSYLVVKGVLSGGQGNSG